MGAAGLASIIVTGVAVFRDPGSVPWLTGLTDGQALACLALATVVIVAQLLLAKAQDRVGDITPEAGHILTVASLQLLPVPLLALQGAVPGLANGRTGRRYRQAFSFGLQAIVYLVLGAAANVFMDAVVSPSWGDFAQYSARSAVALAVLVVFETALIAAIRLIASWESGESFADIPAPRVSGMAVLLPAALSAPLWWAAFNAGYTVVFFSVALLTLVTWWMVRTHRLTAEAERAKAALLESRSSMLTAVVEAGDKQRALLSAELHDGPLQQFCAAFSILDHAAKTDPTLHPDARISAQLIQTGIQQMRTVLAVNGYQFSAGSCLSGSLPALPSEVAALGYATPVDVAISDQVCCLGKDVAPVVVQVVREAVINAAKHAGAGRIKVSVAPGTGTHDGQCQICICDDGDGLDEDRVAAALGEGHLGMRMLIERARALGAELTLDSAPGAGTSVCVWVPLQGPSRHAT